MIQNTSNFLQGVGTASERAITYFGSSGSNSTRRRHYTMLTGNDKEGRAAAILNSIHEKTGEHIELIVGMELPELSIWQRFT